MKGLMKELHEKTIKGTMFQQGWGDALWLGFMVRCQGVHPGLPRDVLDAAGLVSRQRLLE